jgi:hypothetical protein
VSANTPKLLRSTSVWQLLTFVVLTHIAFGQTITSVSLLSKNSPDTSVSTFEQLAQQAIISDSEYLGRNRLKIIDNQLVYDFAPIPLENVLQKGDPYAAPLEAFIRADALQRDIKKFVGTKSSLLDPLATVEQVARQMVVANFVVGNASERRKQLESQGEQIDSAFKALEIKLRDYAAQNNLQIQGRRGGQDFFMVEVHIEPPRARIHFMPYLAYRKCVLWQRPLSDAWNDLLPGKRGMIGRYFYVADWPSALGGRETNSFEIREDTKVTFTPPLK